MMHVYSHCGLEKLAETLFERLAERSLTDPGDVLARRACIVVPSRVVQVWLQQQYLFHDNNTRYPRTLTQCDFPLVNVFVNDWLFRMKEPAAAPRDPAAHPFSVESMQWRIYRILGKRQPHEDGDWAPLSPFLGHAPAPEPHHALRRFQLAGRLARVFDGYMVYRPEMLSMWEARHEGNLHDSLKWQPKLWRELTAGDLREATYLAAFRAMDRDLRKCGIENVYEDIHVFCPSILPRVYQVFFQCLSETINVCVYAFNPSPTDWIIEDQANRQDRAAARMRLDAADEQEGLFDQANPLLAGLGRGIHEFLSEFLDLAHGDLGCIEAEPSALPVAASTLSAMQRGIAANSDAIEFPARNDDSLQIHVCHSPQREVEVLRDQMLHWFSERKWQPRDVQVQVSDMALYAPYIEAAFSTQLKNASDTVPYVLADRILAGESMAADGFLRLLTLADSRFSAPETMELLQCDSMRAAFGFGLADFETVHDWLVAAGIRWGRDSEHRDRQTGVKFTAATTWQYGLDRLLSGYAFGAAELPFPENTVPLPCDRAEGDHALLLGKLARFIESLGGVADFCDNDHSLDEWVTKLDAIIDAFFRADNETYRDIAIIRAAVEALRKSAEASNSRHETVGIGVVRNFIRSHLQGAFGGDDMAGNAVVFSALRPGSSAPRKAMCLLGMADGAFPRPENRPAYDLLRVQRKRLDRTPRIDDRTAFLEALMSPSDVFWISYTGFSSEDASEIPSSVLVRELLDVARQDRSAVVIHKLRAYDPLYFQGRRTSLFSYSRDNYLAACEMVSASNGNGKAAPVSASRSETDGALPPAYDPSAGIELDTLIAFFGNPAKYYCTRILGILFDRRAQALDDAEEFTPGSLNAYQSRQSVIDAHVAGRTSESDRHQQYRALMDQGLVPLAAWGEKWFGQRWQDIGSMLGIQFDGLGVLLDALKTHGAAEPGCEKHVVAGGASVVGKIVQFGDANAKLALDFHSVKRQAQRIIAAWLRHVFACAAGCAETRFCVQMFNSEQKECLRFDPIGQDAALERLTEIVGVFLRGNREPLLFAPESGMAYMEQYLKKPKKGEPEEPEDVRRRKAEAKALGKWVGDGFSRGEGANPYLYKYFGEKGKFGDERFVNLVSKVLQPICESAVNVKAG